MSNATTTMNFTSQGSTHAYHQQDHSMVRTGGQGGYMGAHVPNTDYAPTTCCDDTDSSASDTSAAVVSLYFSWSSSEPPSEMNNGDVANPSSNCSVVSTSSSSCHSAPITSADAQEGSRIQTANAFSTPKELQGEFPLRQEIVTEDTQERPSKAHDANDSETVDSAPHLQTAEPSRQNKNDCKVQKQAYSAMNKMSSEELLDCLKRRCREGDIPPVPIVRKRRLPNCRFLNFMGSRRASTRAAFKVLKPSVSVISPSAAVNVNSPGNKLKPLTETPIKVVPLETPTTTTLELPSPTIPAQTLSPSHNVVQDEPSILPSVRNVSTVVAMSDTYKAVNISYPVHNHSEGTGCSTGYYSEDIDDLLGLNEKDALFPLRPTCDDQVQKITTPRFSHFELSEQKIGGKRHFDEDCDERRDLTSLCAHEEERWPMDSRESKIPRYLEPKANPTLHPSPPVQQLPNPYAHQQINYYLSHHQYGAIPYHPYPTQQPVYHAPHNYYTTKIASEPSTVYHCQQPCLQPHPSGSRYTSVARQQDES